MAEAEDRQGEKVYVIERPARGSGCFVKGLLLVLGAGLGFSFLLNLALLGQRAQEGVAEGARFRTQVVKGEAKERILLIELEGVITDPLDPGSAFRPTPNPVEAVERRLDVAALDPQMRAVCLRITSPGGSVGASDRIWKAVRDFKEKTGKPVVVSMGEVCASGGYYVAAAADEILAEPTTITGSIGVILSTFNLTSLLEKIGVESVIVKSGENKDLLSPFQPTDPEDRAILEGVIQDAFERFLEVVHQGRSHTELSLEELRKAADGRIYTAKQALDLELIDGIGYLDDALEATRKRAQLDAAQIVRLESEPTLVDLLTGRASADPVLREATRLAETPRLLYLWRP